MRQQGAHRGRGHGAHGPAAPTAVPQGGGVRRFLLLRSRSLRRLDYEERGHDYPPAYVRWTEQRNMQAFLDLLGLGRRRPRAARDPSLSTSPRPEQAYEPDRAGRRRAASWACCWSYPGDRAPRAPGARIRAGGRRPAEGRVGVGCLGAGNFARAVLLPLVAREQDKPAAHRALLGRRDQRRRPKRERNAGSSAWPPNEDSDVYDDPGRATPFSSSRRHDHHAGPGAARARARASTSSSRSRWRCGWRSSARSSARCAERGGVRAAW